MAAPAVRTVTRHRDAPAMLEELLAGGGERLLLVQDSAAVEGRSLLRALVVAAVQRGERVLIALFEVPRERFEAGLSPSVRQRLQFRDGFSDPLGWMGPDPELRTEDLEGLLSAEGVSPGGEGLTLVLDSLTWLLLHLPPPKVCQALGALLEGGPKPGPPRRVLALLHRDLHPPGLLQALGTLPCTRLTLHGPPHPGPATPRLVSVLSHPKKRGVTRKDETFTLLPDGSLRCLGVLRMEEEGEGEERPPPNRTQGSPPELGTPHPVTFRLQLSAAERAAREALPPPYQISPPRRSALLRDPQTIICSPQDEDVEDPDDDLDV